MQPDITKAWHILEGRLLVTYKNDQEVLDHLMEHMKRAKELATPSPAPPPTSTGLAYLPCCNEWEDTTHDSECGGCGRNLDDPEVWRDSEPRVAIYRLDYILEPDLKTITLVLPWCRVCGAGRKADGTCPSCGADRDGLAPDGSPPVDKPPRLCTCEGSPPGVVSRIDPSRCAHCGGWLEDLKPAGEQYGDSYDGWPCEGWDEDQRAGCEIEFEDCSGKPDCPRNKRDGEDKSEEEERESAGDKYQNP